MFPATIRRFRASNPLGGPVPSPGPETDDARPDDPPPARDQPRPGRSFRGPGPNSRRLRPARGDHALPRLDVHAPLRVPVPPDAARPGRQTAGRARSRRTGAGEAVRAAGPAAGPASRAGAQGSGPAIRSSGPAFPPADGASRRADGPDARADGPAPRDAPPQAPEVRSSHLKPDSHRVARSGE